MAVLSAGQRYSLTVTARPTCDHADVTAILMEFALYVTLEGVSGFELSYGLSVETEKLSGMLYALETRRDLLQIDSFVFSTTTIADIYGRWCSILSLLPCPLKSRPTSGDYHDLLLPRISISC